MGSSELDIVPRSGFPPLVIDFHNGVKISRTTDPDDTIQLDIANPRFTEHLILALDQFYVPRRS
jgi:hypothetical protein